MLNTHAIMALPAIVMGEGIADETVSLGWLTRIELRGSDYHQYNTDPRIPSMTNAELFALAPDLSLDEWELSRNHWAIKDVDLFRVLYERKMAERPAPRVFTLSLNPVRPKLISVMMRFGGSYDVLYQTLKTAIEAEGYECNRADDFWEYDHVMHDIMELICTSSLVICGLSNKNPNVFYEAGIVQTLGKDFILINPHRDDIPFDLRSLRYIQYLNNEQGRDDLAKVDKVVCDNVSISWLIVVSHC